ncbi:hypothetical protein BC828DRAFT_384930 [Blastocladiella britannica]|nr:hypothetical protein BC828DRAFT_384930 [Blastocladiella britannica]
MSSSTATTTTTTSPTANPPPDSLWTTVSASARSILTRVENGLRDFLSSTAFSQLPTDLSDADHAVILGRSHSFTADGASAFLADFSCRPRLTYRTGFPPIAPSTLTSDSGWGCMIRVGQSLLLEALIRVRLGRNAAPDPQSPQYLDLLSRFRDHPDAMYSIHAIATRGRELDTPIGDWFGPTVLAHAIKTIAADPRDPLLRVVVAQDATVFAADVEAEWARDANVPILLLVPLRLGLDQTHPTYLPFIESVFECPSSVGIAGGRPSAALYMVGTLRNLVLVLDPHTVQPALAGTAADASTCHAPAPQCIALSAIDPSMCMGFVFKTRAEWTAWTEWLTATKDRGHPTPISLVSISASVSLDRMDAAMLGSDGMSESDDE